MALLRANRWSHMTVQCLPAKLHNTPQKITEAVRAKIRAGREKFGRIFVLYGDCGTGGALDEMLAEEGVERIAGAHCYEFFTGSRDFEELSEAEPRSFYLTDFLARHFDRLIIQGLGIDRYPELLPLYFGNYTRLVYLAQFEDPARLAQAREAAARLGLAFEYRFTGYGELAPALARANGSTGGAARSLRRTPLAAAAPGD
ncbi:MAG TPA: DUF1638 domain-containing protein [Alphaproteobacteria bacterium]|nr:DUF1638 domain-containing protein [Alphaproteobacteria bacterium]